LTAKLGLHGPAQQVRGRQTSVLDDSVEVLWQVDLHPGHAPTIRLGREGFPFDRRLGQRTSTAAGQEQIGRAAEVEAAIGTDRGCVLGGFSAVVAHAGGNRIADYETILVYGDAHLDAVPEAILIGGWGTWVRTGGPMSHNVDLILDRGQVAELEGMVDDLSESRHLAGTTWRATWRSIRLDLYVPHQSRLGANLQLRTERLAAHEER
jgi:hypothetical protein